ncbi:MAG: ROK family protein [Rhodospirillaceae bacterium]|nr:ROK family protein [Rhodospirillaceae bacterium]
MTNDTSPSPIRIGVDLGGTKIEAVALDRAGAIRFRKRVPTPTGDYDRTVRAIAELAAQASHETISLWGTMPPTIGVGIPGTISPATGLIKNANSVCLIGHALDRDLAQAIGREVRLANDADCFALSEASDGAGASCQIVLGAILGTGVGGGLVIDKRILRGPNAITGEWGHNPLPWPTDAERPGRKCYCGQSGCIETFLSGAGLSADYAAHTKQQLTAEAIVEKSLQGEFQAVQALDRYVERLARALATIVNVIDPSIIVLGGGLSNIARLYSDVPALLPRYVFSDSVVTPLVPPMHGDSSGVRGAAWLWP